MKQRVKVVPTCPNYANQKGTIDRIEGENRLVILDNYKHFNELEFHANELILIDTPETCEAEIRTKIGQRIEKRYEEVKAKLAKLNAPFDPDTYMSRDTHDHGVKLQKLQYKEELDWLKSLLDGE